jgi:hypothetical protein
MPRFLTLSVVVPVYNEERTIEAILRKVAAARLPEGMGREIVVVNDASKDGTRAIVENLRGELSLRVFDQDPNQGKGAAVKRGMLEAAGDFVVIQDADLEYDPADYMALLGPLVKGQADAVFGSRYLGKRVRDLASVNYVANRILTAASNLFTGFRLTDMETCYKAFTKVAARAVAERLSARRFDMEPEIATIVARQGFRVAEVPVSYDPRTAREGKKIKWQDGFPALWSIVKKGVPAVVWTRAWTMGFSISLLALIAAFAVFLGPHELGDTPTYAAAANVLHGASAPQGFVPNRVLTTFLGLEIASSFSNMFSGWFFMNAVLFVLAAVFMFKLVYEVSGSCRAAYLGGLFLAGNYGFLLFGLNYSMDVGGWAFYIFSLYFLWRYSATKDVRLLFASAAAVGIGGLFKEYAFLGAAAIAAYLIGELAIKKIAFKDFLKRAGASAAIALAPFLVLSVAVSHAFGYTYADWFGANNEYYVYASRLKEFVKALGSLHNLLLPLALGGLWVIWKERKATAPETKAYLFAAFVSCLPVFVWPAITERILAPTVPVAVLFAAFLFRRYARRWYIFAAILALYILATFFMDSYLLSAINLPF